MIKKESDSNSRPAPKIIKEGQVKNNGIKIVSTTSDVQGAPPPAPQPSQSSQESSNSSDR